jgi:hypothetical protein
MKPVSGTCVLAWRRWWWGDGWERMMPGDAFDRDAEYDQIVRGTTLRQLRDLPDDELVRRYDFLMAEAMPFQLGPDGYLNELTRRETERQNRRLEWLTGALLFLTLVLLVATGVLARGGSDGGSGELGARASNANRDRADRCAPGCAGCLDLRASRRVVAAPEGGRGRKTGR